MTSWLSPAAGAESSSGTYAVDGEKLIVTVDAQQHIFIRDGNCIEDRLNVFGKLCKGGKTGEAANVSTRNVLVQGALLVLKFVNDGYESTSFGLLMNFVRQ